MAGSTAHTEIAARPGYYARQVRLPEIGLAGQRRLAAARVAVVGLGALGCPAATYLVRAGVGELRVLDGDRVDETNLHRQPLYTPEDLGRFKADVGARALRAADPNVRVVAHPHYLDGDSTGFGDADLVLDCTDRFSSRFAVHDLAQARRLPLVSAAVAAFTGQLQVYRFDRGPGPCLRCLYPHPPADGCTGSCADDGILGAAAGVMGSLQALTALRVLLGEQTVEQGSTLTLDLVTMRSHTLSWERDPGCPGCGTRGDATDEPVAPEANAAVPLGPRPDGMRPNLRRDTILIDLREPGEGSAVDAVLLPNARRLPLATLPAELNSLDPHGSYLLVCEHGVRSRRAMNDMREAGFAHVSHLDGGFSRLRESVCSE